MKSIKQKFKVDSSAFEQDYDVNLHDSIMSEIKHQSTSFSSNSGFPNEFNWKLTLSVLSLTFVGLFSLVVITSNGALDLSQKSSDNFVGQGVDENNSNMYQSAATLESHITNPILIEQQALLSDINKINSLFAL